MQTKLVAFDMDGTLFDSTKIVGACYRETVQELGFDLPLPTDSDLLANVGQPFKVIMANVFPLATAAQQLQIGHHGLTVLTREIRKKRAIIFPGVNEVMDELRRRDISMAIVSNGRPAYLQAVLETYGLSDYFVCVKSLADHPAGGDKGDLLGMAMDNAAALPGATIMVGDRASDYAAARKQQVKFIACSYGHGTPDEWPGADAVIDTLPALLTHIPSVRPAR